MRSLAAFALKGRTQAAVATLGIMALSMVLPPAGVVSLALIALVTLRNGGREGLELVGLAALLSAVVGSLAMGSPWIALAYVVALWLPMWGIALVLRERINLALAVHGAILLGVLVVAGFFTWVDQPVRFWEGLLDARFRPMLDSAPSPEDAAQLRARLSQAAEYMTGIVATGLATTLIMALFLARWWQAELFNPGGFGQEYLGMRSPGFLAVLTLSLLAVAVWGGEAFVPLSRNVLVVLTVLYLGIGTATLHCLCAKARWRRWLLALLYVVVFVVPEAIPPIALFGLADSWANWRRFRQPGTA